MAFLTQLGAVEVRDGDSGRLLWRDRNSGPADRVHWTPRGLLIVRGTTGELRRASDGKPIRSLALPGRVVGAVVRPGTMQVAFATFGDDAVGRVTLLSLRGPTRPRTLLASPGSIGELVASPDGSTLIAARPGAREWVVLPLDGGQARAVTGIAAQFDPGGDAGGPLPRLAGWAPSS